MFTPMYRAKSRETNEFIYGLPYQDGFGVWFMHSRKDKHSPIELIPETITIGTGRKDKNNVMIFEGDIVNIPSAISDECHKYVILYNKNTMAFELRLVYEEFNSFSYAGSTFPSFFTSCEYCSEEIEVVGNIFDMMPRLKNGRYI